MPKSPTIAKNRFLLRKEYRMKQVIILIFLVFFVGGCATSGYKQFYQQYIDVKTLPDLEVLRLGQEPQVYGTDNFDRDIAILRAKRYIVIGASSFNGGHENTKNAATQAKSIGATIVLTNSQYTDTRTTTTVS